MYVSMYVGMYKETSNDNSPLTCGFVFSYKVIQLHTFIGLIIFKSSQILNVMSTIFILILMKVVLRFECLIV